ncbi:MAG: hypothetical protein VX248_12835 [Pseudomonadota bacterium]|nr:hypothetical protein [Pseudomonadota bacterium]
MHKLLTLVGAIIVAVSLLFILMGFVSEDMILIAWAIGASVTGLLLGALGTVILRLEEIRDALLIEECRDESDDEEDYS